MNLLSRTLDQHVAPGTGSLSQSQNQAVLIAGLTCASFSLLVTFVTLQWFILMKRTFRHKLVLLLILSDTFKAIWYFVFPVVVFTRGPVASSSKFCQASGFFLALGIESSDFAIFTIALHSILYIFRPPTKTGSSGGLYKVRKWIPLWWLGAPLLMASLAFVNDGNAYVTSGTLCYLPKRPFWYRLALAWIPRYLIISTIFTMYFAVYVYVSIKFNGFSNLGNSDSNYGTESMPSSTYGSQSIDEQPQLESQQGPDWNLKTFSIPRPTFSRGASFQHAANTGPKNSVAEPWENVSFVTSKHLQGIQTSDFAVASGSGSDGSSQETHVPPNLNQSNLALDSVDPMEIDNRKRSSTPTMNTSYTGDTILTDDPTSSQRKHTSKIPKLHRTTSNDPLQRTRAAIRRQLRYLFIYPLVYCLMWIFPFVSHCLLYDDYFASHPIFWLTVLQTCMLALQASADCFVFSWHEKPWRRIPEDSKFTVHYWRQQSKIAMGNWRGQPAVDGATLNRSADGSVAMGRDTELGMGSSVTPSRATSTHWWEAEGRKRKDSVWLGLDLQTITSRLTDRRGTVDENTLSEEEEPKEGESSRPATAEIVSENTASPAGEGAQSAPS